MDIHNSEERNPRSFSWILSQDMSVVLSRYMTSRLRYVSALANCRQARVVATFYEHAVCGPLDNWNEKRRKLETKEKLDEDIKVFTTLNYGTWVAGCAFVLL